ncbi:unnamed protein product [Ambrosiozyma monospora]|uniref:Unnamed protein product n=1 Tax=Ambrosiozyma monospora TaxID=43982 RepID=A0ACB5SRG5_AMBMO|nr:unnamed protein product [Ambrosiozyma monospora]
MEKVKNGYFISARNSISRIESDFNITPPMKKIDTPLSKETNLFKSKTRPLTATEYKQYRSIVGTLFYFANTVRLYIAYPVSLLSQFLVSPQLDHLTSAKRVLQFLIQTKNEGIFYGVKDCPVSTIDARLINCKTPANKLIDDYPKEEKYKIHVITDASFATDEDRKFQSGYITLFNSNIVSWGFVI